MNSQFPLLNYNLSFLFICQLFFLKFLIKKEIKNRAIFIAEFNEDRSVIFLFIAFSFPNSIQFILKVLIAQLKL